MASRLIYDVPKNTATLESYIGNVYDIEYVFRDSIVTSPARGVNITSSIITAELANHEAKKWIRGITDFLVIIEAMPSGYECEMKVTPKVIEYKLSIGAKPYTAKAEWEKSSSDIILYSRPAFALKWEDYRRFVNNFAEFLYLIRKAIQLGI